MERVVLQNSIGITIVVYVSNWWPCCCACMCPAGHFSLLYDASEGGTGRAMFVNHAAKKYMDVKSKWEGVASACSDLWWQ